MKTNAKRYPKNRYAKKAKVPKVSKATKAYVKEAMKEDKEENWGLIDNSLSTFGYDVPYLVHYSAVSQGGTINTREGDRIQPTRFHFSYEMLWVNNLQYHARVILLQWKPDNLQDPPTASEILNVYNTIYAIHSPYTQSQTLRSKFKVLYDRVHSNETMNTNAGYQYKVNITKFASKYIDYNPGVSSGKNQLYLFVLSNTTQGDAQGPAIRRMALINWKDTA